MSGLGSRLGLLAILIVAITMLSGSQQASWAQGCPAGIPSAGNPQCIPPNVPGSPYYQDPGPAPQYAPPPPPVDMFGSQAVDEQGGVSWAANYRTAGEAERTALESCKKSGGKSCQSMGTFYNQCLTSAVNEEGGLFVGYSTSARTSASKAMADCNRKSANSICRLLALPVCAGVQYSGRENDAANQATPADVEAMSSRLDNRQYWSALAASPTGVLTRKRNRPDKRSAEQDASAPEACKNCKVVATAKNACIGFAWPSDDRPFVETAIHADPAAAMSTARGQCDAKYGRCVASTACSGRAYLNFVPPNPTKAADGSWREGGA